MIFLLLFMGRHPFSGRFLGKGDMPIAKAISELRFAYSAMRADVQMDRPPNTPPLLSRTRLKENQKKLPISHRPVVS
jgi:DNA-binding helix-hairpin-helix protein with protein kinase domain